MTLRKLLVTPKDPIPMEKRSRCVYQIKCSDCPKSYIGQTGRQLSQRIKEHQSTAPSRNPSAVYEPFWHTSLHWLDNIKILNWEDREYPRHVREAIQIRRHAPQLNRDQGLENPSLYSSLVRPKVNSGQQWGVLTSLHSQHHWSSPEEGVCITLKYWGKSQF